MNNSHINKCVCHALISVGYKNKHRNKSDAQNLIHKKNIECVFVCCMRLIEDEAEDFQGQNLDQIDQKHNPKYQKKRNKFYFVNR